MILFWFLTHIIISFFFLLFFFILLFLLVISKIHRWNLVFLIHLCYVVDKGNILEIAQLI